jgi:L-aminopeptidase/D-esterase-like protein
VTASHLTLADVPGILVGHGTDEEGVTGCTVILCGPDGATPGVDVRGSAPGTRETDLIRPTARVERIHAICLCGGSAFGLAAADGVMRYLAEQEIGVETGVRRVPIVAAAVIFDLAIGSATAGPTPELAYQACRDAGLAAPLLEGSVGVGTGATVGKVMGLERAIKAGVGTAARRLPDGTTVGALAVTNAGGNVVDRSGRVLAGVRDDDGGFIDAERAILDGRARRRTDPTAQQSGVGNTTLAVIATDGRLDRGQTRKLAEQGHDALARAIRPVHTLYDGDTVFSLSTGERAVDPVVLGVAATDVLLEAIERSVLMARGRGGLAGLADAQDRSAAS